jgi:uncharacterized protein YndB with AHSA1/START domain
MSNERAQDLQVVRVFDAPLARVWQAWVEAEDVRQWWGPEGFTCTLAEMGFRESGTSLVCMQAPPEFGGQKMYNTWTYTRIAPLERFEYTLRFTDKDGVELDPASIGMPPGIPGEVRNVNAFRALDGGRTELTVTEYGYTSPEVVEISRMGLEQCLDKMAVVLGKGGLSAEGRTSQPR